LITGAGEVLTSFARTLRLSRKGLDRNRLERAQRQALDRWLTRDLPKVPFYEGPIRPLNDLPVVDKTTQMESFDEFNQLGLSADDIRGALQDGSFRFGTHTIGASTGTSGNRGFFIISQAENNAWLGSILAKTIPDLLWRQQRVAVVLPQNTGLYDNAGRANRLDLRFFDLTIGPERWQRELEAFAPTVLVAPPKVLRHLADEKSAIRPVRLFSAAETLDLVDRTAIETRFGRPLEQIYMATEGLLAVTCRRGNLHLAEESVFFEFETVGDGLVSPLITCFRRRVQIMARYRMNDLLRLSPAPCPCGSPLRWVLEVVGRQDDIFQIPSGHGTVLVTPDILRNAILEADRRIDDFRIVQTEPGRIEIHLKPELPEDAASAALFAIENLVANRNGRAKVVMNRRQLHLETGRKLRRVESRIPAWRAD
jgi:putative adenylate-forming enzyme